MATDLHAFGGGLGRASPTCGPAPAPVLDHGSRHGTERQVIEHLRTPIQGGDGGEATTDDHEVERSDEAAGRDAYGDGSASRKGCAQDERPSRSDRRMGGNATTE